MRKVVGFLGEKKLYQFGIRSGVKEEFEFARENTCLYKDEIFPALEHVVKEVKGKPTMIVAHTVKGKGVSYMEDEASWHGNAPNKELADQAIKELQDYYQGLL